MRKKYRELLDRLDNRIEDIYRACPGLCLACQNWKDGDCTEGLYIHSLVFEGRDIGGGPTRGCLYFVAKHEELSI